MRRFAAVQADAHVAYAHVLEFLGDIFGDASAVRADGRADSLARRIVRKFKEVRTQQRFATAEKDYRHLEIGQLVDEGDSLVVRQLVLVLDGLGAGVAMYTAQVTGLGAVPHHHRAAAGSHAILAFVSARFVTQLVAVIRGIHQKLGNANHGHKYRKDGKINIY